MWGTFHIYEGLCQTNTILIDLYFIWCDYQADRTLTFQVWSEQASNWTIGTHSFSHSASN